MYISVGPYLQGNVYDFLTYFDCLVYSAVVDVLSNGTHPASAVNCTARQDDSFACWE
jgi:hypothetical protein